MPVTHYEKIQLNPNQIANTIYQEMKLLVGKWDGIELREDGTGYYYTDWNYHNTWRERGPDAEMEIVEIYTMLSNAAKYFRNLKETQ